METGNGRLAASQRVSARPATAHPSSSLNIVLRRTPTGLPENMVAKLRQGSSDTITYKGVKFQAAVDAPGGFSLTRSIALKSGDDNTINQLLCDMRSDGAFDQLVQLPDTFSLEAMCLMSARIKSTVRGKRHHVRLSIQSNLAEECIRLGKATCFVDLTGNCSMQKGGVVPMLKQAKAAQRDELRDELRHEPEIQEILSAWFGSFPLIGFSRELKKSDAGMLLVVCDDSYKQMLCPHESESSMMEAAREDWEHDAQGRSLLSYQMFQESIFDLVDLWCEEIEVEDFVVFLRGMYKTTQKAKSCGPIERWLVWKHVMEVPRTMHTMFGHRLQVLEDTSPMADWMVDDIVKLIRPQRPYSTCRGLTSLELQAFLSQTPYGAFSKWMIRDDAQNWKRYDANEDGRITEAQLKEALMQFLTTDGFGRDLERHFNPAEEPAATINTTSSRPQSAPATTGGTRAERNRRAIVQKALGLPSPDPRCAPRHAHAYSREAGDQSKGHSDTHHAEVMAKKAKCNQWWLHMKMIRECFKILIKTVQSPPANAHWMKGVMLLTEEELERANKVFMKRDPELTGLVKVGPLTVGLAELIPDRSVQEIKAECNRLFEESDSAIASLDVNEFCALYNAILVQKTDITAFMGDSFY